MDAKVEDMLRTANRRMPSTARCIIGRPFVDPLENLVTEQEEDEGENPNLRIFEMQMLNLWESGGESRSGE
jgi:hypothetical protein